MYVANAGGLCVKQHKGEQMPRMDRGETGNRKYIIRVVILILYFTVSLSAAFPSLAQSDSLEEAKRLYSELVKLSQQGRYDEAIPLGERVLAIIEKVQGAEHPNTADLLFNLA